MHLTNISKRQRGRKRWRRNEGIKVGHNTKNAKKSRKIRRKRIKETKNEEGKE